MRAEGYRVFLAIGANPVAGGLVPPDQPVVPANAPIKGATTAVFTAAMK